MGKPKKGIEKMTETEKTDTKIDENKTNTVKSTEKAAKDKEKKIYSEEDVKRLIASAIADYSESCKAGQTIVQVSRDEYVTVLYLGAIAEGTTVCIGNMGQITYSGGTLDIPKKDFIHGLGIPVVTALLRKRSLIVTDGLSDEERKRFGLLYKDGELLSAEVYYKLLDFSSDEISLIYSKLCENHKRLVAKMYFTAYFEKHDNRVTLENVKALNKISRKTDESGLFTPILEDMGKQLAEVE